jgi:NAD(P) transhydrogenase subunit alpha
MTPDFVLSLTLYVIASFLGAELARRVAPTVYRPPLAGLHAAAGVSIVGAVIVAGRGETRIATVLGFLAVLLATISVVAGFLMADALHRDSPEDVPAP